MILRRIIKNVKMLCCYRIEVSEKIHVNKTSESKEYDTCHYWHFLDKGFKFQSYVCNRCHNLVIMTIILHDIAI